MRICGSSFALLAALALGSTEVEGQDATAFEPAPITWKVGLFTGTESTPSVLYSQCGESEGRNQNVEVGVSAAALFESIGLEGRVARHGRPERICELHGPLISEGGTVYRVPSLVGRAYTTVDLRLLWFPSHAGRWYLALGPGVIWTASPLPYVGSGIGFDTALSGFSLGAELEVSTYRVPWGESILEMTPDGGVSRPVRSFQRWSPVVGVQLRMGVRQP